MYRCEARSVEGFVQQLVVAYVTRGYWFYVTGFIPLHKDLRTVDEKLATLYELKRSKWTNCRRSKQGFAKVHLIRFRYFFVLLATRGQHSFLTRETRVTDIRRAPIKCFGYSIGCYQKGDGKWRVSVRIEESLFKDLQLNFERHAIRWSVERLSHAFNTLPFEPYVPVRVQFLRLLAKVNTLRRRASLEILPRTCLRLTRGAVKVFY